MNYLKNTTLLMFFALLLVFVVSGCSSFSEGGTNGEGNPPSDIMNNVIDKLSGGEGKSIDPKEEEGVSTGQKLKGMEVHFIDVGQADSALIKLSDHTILIDAGDWKGDEVVPYLNQQGIKDIDILIGTHPHADHIGQMDKVLDNFNVEEVWMSGGTNTSQVFQRVLSKIDSQGIGYNEPRAGDQYQIGDLEIDVLSPQNLTNNLNNDSIVTKLTYGDISFLFTGDAEKEAEEIMVNSNQNLKSNILKVGHHGSNTSSTFSFIKEVNPEVSIISVGKDNQYHHPNQSVLDLFNQFNVKTYTTMEHGSIIVSTDGVSYNVETNQGGGKVVTPKTQKEDTNVDNQLDENLINHPEEEEIEDNLTSCVDINNADVESLRNIIYIGESRAKEIVEKRPFNSVDELTKINGIAEGRLSDIKHQGLACVK